MITLPGGLHDAIRLSQALKERGMVHDIDYTWHLSSGDKLMHFICKDPKMETFILLKYS